MDLKNLAALLDPTAPDGRDFIIQLSPEGDEELRLSYGEARRRIAALARGLLKRGLKRGEAVAIVAAAHYVLLCRRPWRQGGRSRSTTARGDGGAHHEGLERQVRHRRRRARALVASRSNAQ
jgi:hypothetical protein